ncbi:molybdopterin converting factor subunit 1 [Deinococcus cellulosilyticus]|uniref:Molybdopterin synthase sulfur carrier subunit n=1 Tax=Deinococcus cellulosilyticus (strain DSM 18568 / NBRC 106333 / KACC 11606 / 5516J-15) TaxID=1223518 RepID=A0A511NAV8_DEIC1|nr:molybdopterin converting factor subunit 1 [Deinococcus cellulosilyticus]GEM49943.1 molybdopterin synthase sulfur carrier subunit [Deinococcus cellulosilyticus NBRC 106333 = KACC 11606]
MRLRILFFARLKREMGVDELSFSAPADSTVRALADLLQERYSIDLKGCMAAVNENYVKPEHVLREGDEVAFLPPVAGGAYDPNDFEECIVTSRPLKLTEAFEYLARPEWGGQAFFTGTVRSPNKGVEIAYLEYEAFAPMAIRVMRQCIQEAKEQFQLGGVYIAHRTGRVHPGELSIIVGVGSAHRRAALEACDFLIEQLKVRLPVWKLERSTSGEEWVEGSTSVETL